MTTANNNSQLLDAWIKFRVQRTEAGASLNQVYRELADQHGCHVHTVHRYLNPAHADRQRKSARESGRRSYQKKKKKRTYPRLYSRVTRRPDSYIPQVFFTEPRAEQLTLEQVTDRLTSLAEGIRFKPSTVEKRVLKVFMERQQAGNIRGPPWLYETTPGVWKYSNAPHSDCAWK